MKREHKTKESLLKRWTQMSEKSMKKCSRSVVIRDMQIEATTRLLEWLTDSTHTGEDAEKGDHLFTAVGVQPRWKFVWLFSR